MSLTFRKKKKTIELPRPLAPLFDTHAHLRSFTGEDGLWAGDALVRARLAGVERIMSIFDPVSDARPEMPDVAGYSAWLNSVMGEVAQIARVVAEYGALEGAAAAREDAVHAQGCCPCSVTGADRLLESVVSALCAGSDAADGEPTGTALVAESLPSGNGSALAPGPDHMATYRIEVGESRRASLSAPALHYMVTGAPVLPCVQYLAGVHPYGAAEYTDAVHAQLEAMLTDPLCTGIGEIGLDYHFDDDEEIESVDHGVQAEAFARQLELACRRNVPVELHLRNLAGDEARTAHVDGLRILDEVGIPQAGCVLHCFGEDRATMEAYLERGCHIAFGGAATFKRNEQVREAFAACPLDRLILETDCPYMAPEPIRGLGCEPAMIAQTADVLIYDRADRTGELPQDIANGIWRTSTALFG